MKLTLTIALTLTFIVSVGMAQKTTKKKKNSEPVVKMNFVKMDSKVEVYGPTTATANISKPFTFQSFDLIASSWIIIGGGDKPMLSFDRYPAQHNKPIESVTIHVKRENTIWLNDSTLVVKP